MRVRVPPPAPFFTNPVAICIRSYLGLPHKNVLSTHKRYESANDKSVVLVLFQRRKQAKKDAFLASGLRAMPCQAYCAIRCRAVEIGALLSGLVKKGIQPADVLSRPDETGLRTCDKGVLNGPVIERAPKVMVIYFCSLK